MNTDSILGGGNYAGETFKAIERGRKKAARQRANTVVAKVNEAEEELAMAAGRYKMAKRKVKRMAKLLKKYKKTGDAKYLNKM